MAGTINTQAQLQVSSSATYTTNAANLITAGLVRTFNENWISSSVVIPMTSSMTVLSSSYAATASVLIGSVVSSSYAYTASSATSAGTASYATAFKIGASLEVTGSANVSGFVYTAGLVSDNIAGAGGSTMVIQPSTNSDILMNPSGTGVTKTSKSLQVSSSLFVTGSLIVTGSIRQFVENTGSKTTTITAVTNSFVGNTQITGSGNGNNAFRVSGSGNFAGSLTVSKNLTLGNYYATRNIKSHKRILQSTTSLNLVKLK